MHVFNVDMERLSTFFGVHRSASNGRWRGKLDAKKVGATFILSHNSEPRRYHTSFIMVRSTSALKVAALLLFTVSLGEVTSASDAMTPQKEALQDIELSSYRADEQGHGRDLGFFDVGFNWNMLMCKYLLYLR